MRYRFSLFLFSVVSVFFAQEDSLLQHYKTYPDDTAKVNFLYEKGFGYRNSDLPAAIKFAKACYKTAEKIDNHYYLAKALNLRAVLKSQMGMDREAALDLQQALELRIKIKDTLSQAIILNNLGNVYSNFGDNERALICYKRSFETARSIFNDEWIQGALLGIAALELKMKLYKSAEGNLMTLIDWAASDKNKEILLECYKSVGICKLKTGDTIGAEGYQVQALDLADLLEDETGKADCFVNLGEISLYKENFRESISYLDQALSISEKNKYKEGLMSCWKTLSAYYLRTKDFKAAHYYLNKHDSTLTANEIQRKDPLEDLWETDKTEIKEAGFLSGKNIFQLIVCGALILLLTVILIKMGNEQKGQKK